MQLRRRVVCWTLQEALPKRLGATSVRGGTARQNGSNTSASKEEAVQLKSLHGIQCGSVKEHFSRVDGPRNAPESAAAAAAAAAAAET